jgi:hypothetical protein
VPLRLVENWISSFVEYTSNVQTTDQWRRWTAVSTVAAALQRKVWMQVAGQEQYANLYVLLVGKPGTGKSNSIKIGGTHFLTKIPTIHLTPDDITDAAIWERLEASTGSFIRDDLPETHLSLTAFVDEWAVFVKENATLFMSILSKLYDNPEVFQHMTRHSGNNLLERPSFNMLGGVTPKQLRDRFTDQTLEGGFPARCILVFDGEQRELIPAALKIRDQKTHANSATSPAQRSLHKKLVRDLEAIHMICGEYEWTREAAEAFVKWYEDGMPPAPQDPRLSHYANRRLAHITKLTMIHAAAKRDERFIELEDFHDARALLLSTEKKMPKAIQSLGTSKHIDALKIAKMTIERIYKQTRQPVREYLVRQALITEVEPHLTGFVLDTLIKSHWARREADLSTGEVLYYPAERASEEAPSED